MGKYVKHRGLRVPSALAHTAVEVGDVVCLNSAGKWVKARANHADTSPAVGVVTAGVKTADLANVRPEVCSDATIANAGTSLATGGEVYLSAAVAGAVTQTAPTGSNNFVQVIGVAVNATDIHYNFGSGQFRAGA